MPPETNTEPQSKKWLSETTRDRLFCITPVSKYLALVLFVILPFLGGWVGYIYAPEKVIEVEKPVTSAKQDNEIKSEEPQIIFKEDGSYYVFNNKWTIISDFEALEPVIAPNYDLIYFQEFRCLGGCDSPPVHMVYSITFDKSGKVTWTNDEEWDQELNYTNGIPNSIIDGRYYGEVSFNELGRIDYVVNANNKVYLYRSVSTSTPWIVAPVID